MTHRFSTKGVSFKCDVFLCEEVFVSSCHTVKTAWAEAEVSGWQMITGHDPISFRLHHCPDHHLEVKT